MKKIELNNAGSSRIIEEKDNYHFFCIDYGTSFLREMVVRWLIFDQASGKQYLVFTPNNSGERYLREFFGDYREKRFIKIADEQVRRAINNIINQVNKT